MAGLSGNVYLEVDSSEAMALLDRVRDKISEEEFERAMYGIFKRMGGRARTIIRNDVQEKYTPPSGEVGRAVKNPQVSIGAGNVGCVIPITGPRIAHGQHGKVFKAKGGRHGWKNVQKPYTITSKILAGAASALPLTIQAYGNRPFRNLSAPKLNSLTFVREGKERLPIHKVVGIAIPQMPMNRARTEVEQDLERYLIERIEHRFREILDSI